MIILMLTFALIALMTIGGGYAMIPLIQNQAIEVQNWITQQDFINILAISQITPGAIAINSATFVGFKSFGFTGAVLASIGLVTPSIIITMIIMPILEKYQHSKLREAIFSGIRPVVTALIASAIFLMAQTIYKDTESISIISISITIISFIILRVFKVKPVFLLFMTAVAGIFL